MLHPYIDHVCAAPRKTNLHIYINGILCSTLDIVVVWKRLKRIINSKMYLNFQYFNVLLRFVEGVLLNILI